MSEVSPWVLFGIQFAMALSRLQDHREFMPYRMLRRFDYYYCLGVKKTEKNPNKKDGSRQQNKKQRKTEEEEHEITMARAKGSKNFKVGWLVPKAGGKKKAWNAPEKRNARRRRSRSFITRVLPLQGQRHGTFLPSVFFLSFLSCSPIVSLGGREEEELAGAGAGRVPHWHLH